MTPDLSAVPGGDLVMRGMEDLAAGRNDSVEALLVQIARPRLLFVGLAVPETATIDAELALYALLQAEGVDDPYSTYNSLLRRLTSCAAALEHAFIAATHE